MKNKQTDPDMLDEYDFSKGVRGKYASRFANKTNVIVIDEDLVSYFPDHDSVNNALRHVVALIKGHGKTRRPLATAK